MARPLLHQKAIDLRKQGKSYGQIKNELGVSKSTLSDWLYKYPLNEEQIKALENLKAERIEKFIQTMKTKRELRLNLYYKEEKKKWMPLSNKEIYLSGLFLYWGEGNKNHRNSISINNTDPNVVKFSLYWLVKALKVPKNKIKILLHLYSDMDIEQETNYWSNVLKMPLNQFCKPYIKESKRVNITQKGFGHGTCCLYVGNTEKKERIMMSLKAIADNFSIKIDKI